MLAGILVDSLASILGERLACHDHVAGNAAISLAIVAAGDDSFTGAKLRKLRSNLSPMLVESKGADRLRPSDHGVGLRFIPWMCNGRGMTLLDALFAVALVAILSTVAYPYYRQHLITLHRADAQRHLLSLASLQHHYRIDAGQYALTLKQLGVPANPAVSDYYRVYFEDADNFLPGTGFRSIAAPLMDGMQASSDTLSIDHLGVVSPKWRRH